VAAQQEGAVMMNSKWKLVALVAAVLMSPGAAGAKDNVGGGGGGSLLRDQSLHGRRLVRGLQQ
jgi:hypothetical protein